MGDMDEDSRLAAQLQAEEIAAQMQAEEFAEAALNGLHELNNSMGSNHFENRSGHEDYDSDALRRYERRLHQEKNKRGPMQKDIKRGKNSGQKSPSLAEKFLNFIGCGEKKKKSR